jgi:hypothetical protein
VDFTALEDDVVEGAESLTAVLTSDDGVILSPEEATINIIDDGGERRDQGKGGRWEGRDVGGRKEECMRECGCR